MADFDFVVKNGLTVSDNVIVNGNSLLIGSVRTYISSNIAIGVTDTVVDSTSTGAMRSATYLMQVSSDTAEYQVSEISVVHNGTDSQMTEYGVLTTGQFPLAAFKTDISNGKVRLLASMHFGDGIVYFQKTVMESPIAR
jgi:hypothetical protein